MLFIVTEVFFHAQLCETVCQSLYSVVDTSSVDSFKSWLDKHWMHQDVL